MMFKKLVLVISGFLVSFGVFADPRLEVNNTGGLVHFPLRAEDADIEAFASDARPHVFRHADGTASGSANWTIKARKEMIGFPYGRTEFDSETTGFVCNMVDSNGQAYTSTGWNATADVSESELYTDEINFSLRCWYGQAQ